MGFDLVRGFLRSQLLGALGEASLSGMTRATTLDEVRMRMGRVAEMQDILQRQSGVPLDGFVDIREVLARMAPAGAYVSGAELFSVLQVCVAMRRLHDWFAGTQYTLLRAVTKQIVVQRGLERHIEATVDSGGAVRCSASAALAGLRAALRHRKEALRTQLLAVLRDAHTRGHAAGTQPTVRGGRMVVPIRVEAKRKVKGFIHGMSATGQTVYIEPAACLALNNEVRLLQEQEHREIVRVLRAAAARIRDRMDELRINLHCLGAIDLVQATARLATRLNASVPRLNSSGDIDIRSGRSPALLLHLGAEDAVVPFDITLGDVVRTLVITGPNAGGKTVTMKAVGLLSIMIAYGMPVPVHPKSSLCLFDRLMVEIGDNQSIEQDLSTFSARIQGLGAMVAQAGRGMLILVDEIGTGTDPAEGAALSQAALERFTAANARTVVTTHHGTLKAFAHRARAVANGSMEFDSDSLRPTFRFVQGLPGSSYAFLIAKRMAFDPVLLARARALLGSARDSLESLLHDVQVQRETLAAKLKATDGRLVRSRVLRHARRKTQGTSPPKAVKRRPGTARQVQRPAFIKVGAQVVLDGGSSAGEITAVEGAQVTVAFGSMRAKVAADRLRPVRRRRPDRPAGKASLSDAHAALDLRGFRVREAIRAVEKLIDTAVRADLDAVQILHGKGTGALRTAIHEYLAKTAAVKEYSSPQVNPGVTYVRLE